MRWGLHELEIPAHLKICDQHSLATEFELLLGGIKADRILVVASPTAGVSTLHAAGLVEDARVRPVGEASLAAVAALTEEAASTTRPDVVVGIGGGKALDVAKRLAYDLDAILVCVPTIVSNDGLASPVAVLRDHEGRSRSLPGATPFAVFVPLDVVRKAPGWSPYAALGDVLGNCVAIEDWRYAASVNPAERVNDYAVLLSSAAWKAAWRLLEAPEQDETSWWQELIEAVMLSSLSMCVAGSSRPASGSEHMISHAIDELHGPLLPHGLQVALGTVATLAAYGDSRANDVVRLFRDRGIQLAVPDEVATPDAFAALIRHAPLTRPDRITRLDVVDASPSDVLRRLDFFLEQTVGV
jgi:glycerol-1-phosphate dehydrogenase [NAD(P)+]